MIQKVKSSSAAPAQLIFWTEREWLTIARSVKAALKIKIKVLNAFKTANSQLPEDRRRPVSCGYEIVRALRKTYFPMLERLENQEALRIEREQVVVARPVEVEVEPATTTQVGNDDAGHSGDGWDDDDDDGSDGDGLGEDDASASRTPAAKFSESLKTMPSLDLSVDDEKPVLNRRVSDKSFEESIFGHMTSFAKVIASRFEEELLSQLHAATEHAMDTVDKSFLTRLNNARKAVKVNKAQLPKVMIVGLEKNQPNEIAEEFGEMLDLRFILATDSITLLKSGARHSDYVVLMTKFISHRHQEAVREHEGLIYANGSVSNLKDVLMPLACG